MWLMFLLFGSPSGLSALMSTLAPRPGPAPLTTRACAGAQACGSPTT
jgi:hypothetical protein